MPNPYGLVAWEYDEINRRAEEAHMKLVDPVFDNHPAVVEQRRRTAAFVKELKGDADFYAEARKGMIYRGQTVDEIMDRSLLLEVIGWLAWGNAEHEKYREQRYQDGHQDGRASIKPTIESLEVLLQSEDNRSVRILPDGRIEESQS